MAISVSRSFIALGVLASGISLGVLGCSVANSHDTATTTTNAPTTSVAGGVSEKGGAELWAETCSRCHNLRSPSSYSAVQWQVAIHDMRVRANLTGEDQRKVLEFMKSASK